jgi:hypothetical protein
MFTITIQRNPISVAFEVGSLSEAIGVLEQEDSQIRKIGAIADDLVTPAAAETAGEGGETEAKKRGRKPKANTPDPATAQAPAPAPTPADPTPGPNGLPAFLDRTAQAAPPPPPPPPPAPPAAPPSGILAGKVIANLDQRKATTADGGKALAEWLVSYGLVNAGSSYDESIAALRLMPDDKLAQVATALSVA